MTNNSLLIAAVVFLAIAAAGARLIGPHNKLPGRNNAGLPIPRLGGAPILNVELARNEDDLRAVLMTGDTARNLDDARAGNRYDTWLFIPGYAGFLLTAGLLLARVNHSRIVLLAALALSVVAIADWTE